ncbi:MAG: hypothetical protein BWX62_00129 [Bacteroidetes bacterium ADurb.Bin037]|nr:MAG: hypothetical protein BWX62_00129 [Bacteroidetes bacterium ADurb.Bin037]
MAKADMIIFRESAARDILNAIPFCVIHDSKVKSKDIRKGANYLYNYFK